MNTFSSSQAESQQSALSATACPRPQLGRYAACFAALGAQKRPAFIPFTLLGWPNLADSLKIVRGMLAAGVDALELGLPFSDPVADGPVIQQAVYETLTQGVRIQDALALIGDIRQMTDIPIGLLVYYNTVLAQGVASFYQQVARLGVDGVLVADLPPEAAEPEVVPLARGHGVAPLFLISPMTSGERLRRIGTVADGFLYAVSRLGITGTHDVYDDTLAQLIGRAHAETTLPVCVGFGISTPAQAKKMVALGADGVITGSGVIQAVRHRGDVPIDEAVRRYCADFMVAP